jgi:hypothetical protein
LWLYLRVPVFFEILFAGRSRLDSLSVSFLPQLDVTIYLMRLLVEVGTPRKPGTVLECTVAELTFLHHRRILWDGFFAVFGFSN